MLFSFYLSRRFSDNFETEIPYSRSMNMFLRKNKKKRKSVDLIIFCGILFLCNLMYAQVETTKTGIYILKDTNYYISPPPLPQMDVIDLIKRGFTIKRDTLADSVKVKPGKLLVAFVPAVGYAPQTGVSALIATNISFYLGKSHTTNLSSVVFSQNYTIEKQIIIPVVTNIWIRENKFNLLGDWRFYKYPTYTYGLGDNTKLSNADLINYSYIKVHQQVLTKLAKHFYGGIGYGLDYHFDIHENGTQSNFNEYNNNATTTISSGALANLLYDNRHNINNPDSGIYCSIKYHPCFTALGSTTNWQSIYCDFRKYIKLSPKGNHVLALWNLDWFTFGGKVPYFDLPSTGWDTYSNSGRGYVQGRYRGGNFIYLESEYRFSITRNGLFGGVAFANAQSVSDYPGTQFQKFFPAVGTGIRIKVNKYSKVNFAIDYAVGMGGSQGLYFNLSELF